MTPPRSHPVAAIFESRLGVNPKKHCAPTSGAQKSLMDERSLDQSVALVYGSRPTNRARLIAVAIMRCSLAEDCTRLRA